MDILVAAEDEECALADQDLDDDVYILAGHGHDPRAIDADSNDKELFTTALRVPRGRRTATWTWSPRRTDDNGDVAKAPMTVLTSTSSSLDDNVDTPMSVTHGDIDGGVDKDDRNAGADRRPRRRRPL